MRMGAAWIPTLPRAATSCTATTAVQRYRRQHCVSQTASTTRVNLSSNKKEPPSDGASYSYVEGLEFDNERDEILAMGGDPSFLPPDDIESPADVSSPPPPPPPPDNGNEEESKFLWDGEVDEDAYFDD